MERDLLNSWIPTGLERYLPGCKKNGIVHVLKKQISAEVVLAIAIGGIAFRVLSLFM
jgi:hypothetical protein